MALSLLRDVRSQSTIKDFNIVISNALRILPFPLFTVEQTIQFSENPDQLYNYLSKFRDPVTESIRHSILQVFLLVAIRVACARLYGDNTVNVLGRFVNRLLPYTTPLSGFTSDPSSILFPLPESASPAMIAWATGVREFTTISIVGFSGVCVFVLVSMKEAGASLLSQYFQRPNQQRNPQRIQIKTRRPKPPVGSRQQLQFFSRLFLLISAVVANATITGIFSGLLCYGFSKFGIKVVDSFGRTKFIYIFFPLIGRALIGQ